MSAALWRLIGGVLVLTLGYGVYQHGRLSADAEWQARWAEQGEFQAKALVALGRAARAEEQRRQAAINQVERDAHEHTQAAAADADSADVAGERLHLQADQLATSASQCSSDTDIAGRGQAATRAAMVLSDLLKRADARAGELAKAYDAARIAGMACEAVFDSL